ncbi:MAG: universal stress protein [Rhodothermales bacterium]
MNDYSVFIPVALPSSGPELLRVARLLAPPERLRITALHCWTDREFRSEAFEHRHGGVVASPLLPLLKSAEDVQVDALCFVSSDIGQDILSTAAERLADLIVMGWHGPMVTDNETPGPMHAVLESAACDVAILLPRQFREIRRVLVPFYGGMHDRRAVDMAVRMAAMPGLRVTVLHVVPPPSPESSHAGLRARLVDDVSNGRVRVKLVEDDDPVNAIIREAWMGYDLLVAGASETWGIDSTLFSEPLRRLAFATPASLLVVRAGDSVPADRRAKRGAPQGRAELAT